MCGITEIERQEFHNKREKTYIHNQDGIWEYVNGLKVLKQCSLVNYYKNDNIYNTKETPSK